LAVKSEQLQKTLFNSISHELRTPLAVIQAATTQLAAVDQSGSVVGAGKIGNLVGEIQQATSRLNRLVQNLLNSARLESGQLQPKREWGEVDELFSGATQLLGINLPHESLRLEVAAELPLVHGDFGLLQQAIANLIDNALVHTPGGTPIHLMAHAEAGELLISVADEGPGLHPDTLPHLFEKFYRASDARPGGTGLGLSIAKSLVEANHGKLEVANRPKGGAIFTIRLPIENAPKLT
jgi:two-component system sensor histidine kinase KdpD